MAVPARRKEADPVLVTRVEKWIDMRIPNNATEYSIKVEELKHHFADLIDVDLVALGERYKPHGWNYDTNHWVGRSNGDGPYFQLTQA